MRAVAGCCVVLTLAGCGGLPRPFQGAPGAQASRLAQPPPARLAVPVPTAALLADAAATDYAAAVAEALLEREVPAVADVARKGDWKLNVTAELRGDKVVPVFTVANPTGGTLGTAEGTPVDAAQWSDGAKPMLQASAATAAPGIAALLTRIEAARRASDPNSLTNRPARVLVSDVTGAPGDGNGSLTKRLREQLPQHGEVVQETAAGADFAVLGVVKLAPGSGDTQRVEIQWTINDPQGRELGRVLQLNEVPAHALDAYWGDVALVVAREAAGGIRDVIANASGTRGAPATGAAAPATTPAKPPPPFLPAGTAPAK